MTRPNLPSRDPLRHGWAPTDPARRPVLFINPRSGGGKAARTSLADHARERGIEVVELGPDTDLATLAAEAVASGTDALGVAGGDGSLAVVAAAAAAHEILFVCIPAGTRNLFALDWRDVVGALDAFTDGVERRIDVARVNGRLFLNNVSLGVYGDAVNRPEYRDAKTRTMLQTAEAVLGPGKAPPDRHLVDDRGHEHPHPAVLLLSNNPYALHQPIMAGTRPSLTSGRLGILVLDRLDDRARPPRTRPSLDGANLRARCTSADARRDRRRTRRTATTAPVHDRARRPAATQACHHPGWWHPDPPPTRLTACGVGKRAGGARSVAAVVERCGAAPRRAGSGAIGDRISSWSRGSRSNRSRAVRSWPTWCRCRCRCRRHRPG